MSALTLGLIVGIGTEIYIEAASVRNQSPEVSSQAASSKISFEQNAVEPKELTIARGEYIVLVNTTDKPLEIEANGLTNKEVLVPKNGQSTIQITGTPGKYPISPEGSAYAGLVNVIPGQKNMQEADSQKVVAALTILEGHVQAAYDLHIDSRIKDNPNAEVDLARAKKHSYHPVHELFEEKTTQALLVQSMLQKNDLLDKLKEGLKKFSQLAGNGSTTNDDFAKGYANLLALVEQARRTVGGESYSEPTYKAKVALLVLAQAEDEYKDAVSTGRIVVLQAATPGKDGFLEYQDTRGFLKATRVLLNPTSDSKCESAQIIINGMLGSEFKEINPSHPNHPVPFKTIENRVEALEKALD
jgi:hypothetical protein